MIVDGYNPQYDIAPDWQNDLSFGQAGEIACHAALRALVDGLVEVKTERYANGRVFVEVEQKPRGASEWKPSGLMVTTAAFFAYIKPGGFIIFFPVAALKEEVAAAELYGRKISINEQSDNPARGYLVDITALLERQQGRK